MVGEPVHLEDALDGHPVFHPRQDEQFLYAGFNIHTTGSLDRLSFICFIFTENAFSVDMQCPVVSDSGLVLASWLQLSQCGTAAIPSPSGTHIPSGTHNGQVLQCSVLSL